MQENSPWRRKPQLPGRGKIFRLILDQRNRPVVAGGFHKGQSLLLGPGKISWLVAHSRNSYHWSLSELHGEDRHPARSLQGYLASLTCSRYLSLVIMDSMEKPDTAARSRQGFPASFTHETSL
jgi:hypothetical protein